MRIWQSLCTVTIVALMSVPARGPQRVEAQSLGDLARQEQARRNRAEGSKKTVYTNADLVHRPAPTTLPETDEHTTDAKEPSSPVTEIESTPPVHPFVPPGEDPNVDPRIRAIINQSIASYQRTGKPCPCPYNLQGNGNSCGDTSVYIQEGGASPMCYPDDVPVAEPIATTQPAWQAQVPVMRKPAVRPSCSMNTAREQAMSNFTRAGGVGGPSQPLPPCPSTTAP